MVDPPGATRIPLVHLNAARFERITAARFTVAGWTGAVLGLATEGGDHVDAGSPAVAFVVLPAIAIAGFLLTVWRYRRADVD